MTPQDDLEVHYISGVGVKIKLKIIFLSFVFKIRKLSKERLFSHSSSGAVPGTFTLIKWSLVPPDFIQTDLSIRSSTRYFYPH
jgi:hypothetical protein